MSQILKEVLKKYVEDVHKIYGEKLRTIILYGSYARGELEDVQSDLSENLQQVQKLDERIESSQAELDELNTQITELQTSIDEISAKLEQEEETYSNQKNLLDKRLVAMYEEGETSYLDVILSSSSLAEFLSNYAYLSEIAKYENELLLDIQSRKKEIELEKEKLANNQEQLATIKANQTKTARILENTKTVRENFIAKLSDEEKNIQAQIDEYNRMINRFSRVFTDTSTGF